jgi:hypothetical protein
VTSVVDKSKVVTHVVWAGFSHTCVGGPVSPLKCWYLYTNLHTVLLQKSSHWQYCENQNFTQSRKHIFSQALITYFILSARFSALYIYVTCKAKVCMNCSGKFVFMCRSYYN